jgi:hypothetical protein
MPKASVSKQADAFSHPPSGPAAMAPPDNPRPGETRNVRSNNGKVLKVMAGSPDTVRFSRFRAARAVSRRLAHGFRDIKPKP